MRARCERWLTAVSSGPNFSSGGFDLNQFLRKTKMMQAVTREEMIALDGWAIQSIGIPGIVLMENAGRAAAERVRVLAPNPRNGAILVVSGKGNNGGDGFVIARHLWNWGYRVAVRVFRDLEQFPPGSDSAVNLAVIRKLGLDLQARPDGLAAADFDGAALIVDALFGTGLVGAPRSPASLIIDQVNEAGAGGVPVLAVDIPSGLDCNTGETPGSAVRANWTVTFACAKVGFTRGNGPAHVGNLEIADISIPRTGPGRPGCAEGR